MSNELHSFCRAKIQTNNRKVSTMSTHAIIASDITNRLGRYLHSDGYPSHTGAQLVCIIQRDGVQKAVETLCVEHYGWSFIDTSFTEAKFNERRAIGFYDNRFGFLPGYGIFYTENDDVTANDFDDPKSDGVFGYIINSDGTIEVYEYGKHIATINALADDAEVQMEKLGD